MKRKLGIGDVQHIRNQLLCIGMVYGPKAVEVMHGCFEAGRRLNMLTRIQAVVNSKDWKDITNLQITGNYIELQPMMHDYLIDRYTFELAFETLDIILEADDLVNLSVKQVADGIIETWHSHGERFIGGNFGYLHKSELKRMHPSFDLDVQPYWEAFSHHANSL